MSDLYVLVHEPLVGRSTWRWVAEVLGEATVAVPDLHAGDRGADFGLFVRRVAEVIPSGADVTLVGHSGSGVLLPFAAFESDAARVS